MIRPKVKICGLKAGDNLDFAQHPLVSHIGFVQVQASRRYINPDDAKVMVQALEHQVQAVGVFANQSVDEVIERCHRAGFTVAQLHGQESLQDCEEIRRHGLQVWKAISVSTSDSSGQVQAAIEHYRSATDALLLDAAAPNSSEGVTGGWGKSFDWHLLPQILRFFPGDPIWIAGGLRPDNVSHLLSVTIPYGLDVSSGVEIGGRKSSEKIAVFLERVNSFVHTNKLS